MLRGICRDSLVLLALLSLTLTGSKCSAQDEVPLVTLPGWRANADYVTQCFYDKQQIRQCDWTWSQQNTASGGAINILKSGALRPQGEACLEFWYFVQGVGSSSTIQVQLRGSLGVIDIWTTTVFPTDSWRQVFVPLTVVEQGTQIVLMGERATFDYVGVRRGSCGQQCSSNTDQWTDESTLCVCTAGQLSCSCVECPDGQICGPQRQSSPGMLSSGTCAIHSDTDCSTFDGVLFRFMAPCTYILAKTCSSNESLSPFTVEVVNEENGNSSLTTVKQVIVILDDLRISLLKRQTHRVAVNGIWKKLPLTLSSGTVIKGNRAAVVVETKFGLTVSYDSAGAVHVNVPSYYSDKVCGLCGNFNRVTGDDLRMPDGTDAQNATELVESWQTGESTSSCETILVPHQCDLAQEAEYAGEAYCGGLLSNTGPFSGCLAVLEVESYFRRCVAGMCSSHGDPTVLCETLESYAQICKEAGMNVPSWRNSTFCPFQCGENSRYNPCAQGCPEVCSGSDLAGSCGSCVERCECDSGFKRSGGKCVPAGDCGCWLDGQHYEKGAAFMKGDCTWQCLCMGDNVVRCGRTKCSDNEVCKVKDGVKGCFSFQPATCSVYGDPHYTTYDGFRYDFQGGCSYTLTTTCGGESAVKFTVIGHNMHPPHQNYTRSKLEAVTLQVAGLYLTLNQSGAVYTQNGLLSPPFSLHGQYGTVTVHTENNYITLETTFGLRMMIDGQNRLFLQVDEQYKYELCGLCGTYSDHQDDDLVTPEGKNATGSFEFGDSWRVQRGTECVAYPNKPTQCDSEAENDGYRECNTLLGDAFQPCHEVLHPEAFITSCVYDYCVTSGDRHTLCDSLESYARACQVAGVELVDWQKDTACAEPTTTAPSQTSAPISPTPNATVCPINCDFEQSLCGWEQLIQDSFDWTRHSGATPSQNTGPNQDHTSGAGFYMYIEGNGVTHGDSAHLLSSMCHLNGPVCLNFWYHMYGSATAMAFNIYVLKGNKSVKIWSLLESQGPHWYPGQVEIAVSGPFQVILEGIRGSTEESDVAIDDISIHLGSCSGNSPGLVGGGALLPPATTAVLPSNSDSSFNCTFDQGLCNWNQMLTDAFDWTWQNGSTPTLMTGPSADHTGGGHYLYIEASSQPHGNRARLISPESSNSGPQCLQFWYHMYGSADTMGLHVYLVQGRVATRVWLQRNDQGNMWHEAQVEFIPSGPFQIIFEGRRGSNDQSDVAIDDIKLHDGPCAGLMNSTEAELNSSLTISEDFPANTRLMNSTEDDLDYSMTISEDLPTKTDSSFDCNFDQGLCNWNQMLTDAFDWTWQSGSTPTLMTGPSADHTGGGHYFYIEASSQAHGNTARLISPESSNSGPQCLQFWYHMYGSADTMGLHVYLVQGRVATRVWLQRNDQGNMWHEAQVEFIPSGPFQIIFEGRRGSNDQSDVAIDDIKLHDGPCAGLMNSTEAELNSSLTISEDLRANTGLMNTTEDDLDYSLTISEDLPTKTDSSFDCNFDQGLCNWNQMLTDAFDWTWQSGSTPTLMTGPSADHTGGGHYFYIEASSQPHGNTARLISPESSNSGPQCLQFWYHMYGSADTMGLHVYLIQGRVATRVWLQRNDQGNMWHEAQVEFIPSGPFQIIFEGRRGSNDQSDVAIDDIKLHDGPCAGLMNSTEAELNSSLTISEDFPANTRLMNSTEDDLDYSMTISEDLPTKTDSSFDCNFDQGLCNWNQMLTDAFDWTWQSGSTPTLMTGPSADHTGGGHYFYIEASSQAHGNTARLISPESSNSGPQCLQFWYHMYGSADTMGLHVYLVQGRVATRVWLQRNDQGNMWHEAQVEFIPSGPFQIIFEGRRGSNDQSDVAIDDIKLHDGPCAGLMNSTEAELNSSLTISEDLRANTGLMNTTEDDLDYSLTISEDLPTKTDSSFDCNFDQGLCNWNQMLTDAFDWTWQSGSTPTLMTGPSADHTGGGHYLYIEASSQPHGNTARLISPESSNSGPQCLQFWYHMYGSADTMGLHVYLVQGRVATRVWLQRNDQGNMWHEAQVDFTPSGPFQIIFEGRRGSNDQSDVAIDDIKLHDGPCAGLMNSSEAELNSSLTISEDFRANTGLMNTTEDDLDHSLTISEDLPTKTDSSFDCNFDQGLCNWNQMLTDAFDWTWQSGSTPTLMTGPSADHTGGGRYLYIEASSQPHGNTARLISLESSNSGPQCLQFWYHMYGSADTMGLHVYLVQGRVATRVWLQRNDQGNMWHEAQVDFTPSGPFQIIFEGRRGSNEQSDVAIDDITLHHGPCAGSELPPANNSTPQPPTTTVRPQNPTTSAGPQTPMTTTGPQPTTIRPQPATTTSGPHPATTTAGPHPATTTAGPQPATTTAGPQPATTTAGPHPATTTAGPQPATTTAGPHPATTTAGPHPATTTAGPQPATTTAGPHPTTTTSGPHPATTTAGPHPATTTAGPHPATTTAGPHPATTTAGPHPATTTAGPQPATTTAGPQPATTTAGPQPATTTTGPHPATTTAGPHPATTTAAPHPATTTAGPHPATTTAGPQPATTTAGPHPATTTAGPQPATTTAGPHPATTTAGPQPATTTAGPQPATTTAGPHPATTTAGPQPATTTAGPHPATTTAGPQPATTTAGPQPATTTAGPQPATTTAGPHPATTTAGPHPATTTAGPQPVTTTARPQPVTTTARPQPETTTAGPQPVTTTAGPQPPTTTRPRPSEITTPSCPVNSHYNTCVPVCYPTCAHLNGPPNCKDDARCQEGCVCDDGFVLKGKVCVPILQCGCVDRNGNKHQFSDVWHNNHCSERCKCERDDGVGKIDCDDGEKCEEGSVCLQSQMGDYYCHEADFEECNINGDPEYRTFDHWKYRFLGEHSYVLVQTHNLPNHLKDIYIEGINSHIEDDGDDGSSSSEESHSRQARDDDDDDDSEEHDARPRLQELKIRVYNYTVELKPRRKLVVNGKRTDLPFSPSPGLTIRKRSRIHLETDFGLSVEFDGRHEADITLPHLYRGMVKGLCGNYDRRKRNDRMKPDGTMAATVQEFGESWRV